MKKSVTASNPSPSENRQGETRRPIERIFAIHQSVRRDRYPNCRTLAAEIGVTPKTIQRDITFMQKDLAARDSGVVPADFALFEKVARAILESCELRFDYRKIDGDEWESRRLQPYHLTEFDGGWYVIGYDPDRKSRRTFALQRIRKARPVKVRFLRPADFSLNDHLGGSFGVWHNPADQGKRSRIRLRFTGWAARLVSERRWHPSQQIEWKGKQADELIMTLELSSFEEIRRWILSWGTQVEVLEPKELRADLKKESEGLAAVYRKK